MEFVDNEWNVVQLDGKPIERPVTSGGTTLIALGDHYVIYHEDGSLDRHENP